ncbi:MAG TPA: hypothetical protein VHT00_14265 [Stellaceae bacterium]|nr:hypothetical protein [Stellaceae bacterium]
MRDPDDVLVVIFKYLPMQNQAKTLAEGRPIFDDVEVCEVRAPGSKDVKVFPATAFTRWETDPMTGDQRKVSYAERFSHQYRQFKAAAAQTKTGTPLEHAPFLTEGRRAELRAQNVYTVEQLAAIDGAELKNLGPGGREFKNKAIEFIEESKTTAPNLQLAAELEVLRARNAVLEEDVVSLRSAKARAEKEFEDMSDEQLRDYVTANTGGKPHGTLPRKSLLRMAMEARPDKAA